MADTGPFVTGLKCLYCDAHFSPGVVTYTCPGEGENLDVQYDYAALKAHLGAHGLGDQPGMWRYRSLLPLPQAAPVPPLLVGGTPLYPSHCLAEHLGVAEVWIKDDGRNPTASLKDRASALIVARAMLEGHQVITTASTGNAAAALAGLAASVGLRAVIFVPASAPAAKVAQLLAYGAQVLLVEGTYDDAFDLCLEATHAFGWYCRSTGYNPYTVEGKKTVAYEIAEQLAGQLGSFSAPDQVFVSVGDGNIIGGVYKGLFDLVQLGYLPRLPQIVGVQAEGSAALHHCWQAGTDPHDLAPIATATLADSISAGLPRDRVRAIRAVQASEGYWLAVPDERILAAIPALARQTGVFAEPSAAIVYAAAEQAAAAGLLRPQDRIVLLITGSGLKDAAAVQRACAPAPVIRPDLRAVEKALNLF